MNEDQTIDTTKNVVSIHIFEKRLKGYDFRFGWQVFVDGEHWMSSTQLYYFDHQARSAGVIALMKADKFFTKWQLSE